MKTQDVDAIEDIDIFIGMERIRVGTTARIGAAVTAPTDIDCSRAERGEPGGQALTERQVNATNGRSLSALPRRLVINGPGSWMVHKRPDVGKRRHIADRYLFTPSILQQQQQQQ